MPSTKKSTKKKNTSLFARFTPNTFTSRLVAIVLAFAVVGGGIMVYRSFALGQEVNYTRTNLWSYSLASNSIGAFATPNCGNNPITFPDEPLKNNIQVTRLYCIVGGSQAAVAYSNSNVPAKLVAGKSYRVCAWVMKDNIAASVNGSTSSNVKLKIARGDGSTLVENRTSIIYKEGRTAYDQICGFYYDANGTEGKPTVSLSTASIGTVRVSAIELEEANKVTPPPPSTPQLTAPTGNGKNQ